MNYKFFFIMFISTLITIIPLATFADMALYKNDGQIITTEILTIQQHQFEYITSTGEQTVTDIEFFSSIMSQDEKKLIIKLLNGRTINVSQITIDNGYFNFEQFGGNISVDIKNVKTIKLTEPPKGEKIFPTVTPAVTDKKQNSQNYLKENQTFDKRIETCKKLLENSIELYEEQQIIITKQTNASLAALEDRANGRNPETNDRRAEKFGTEFKSINHKLSLIRAQLEKLGCSDYYGK